MPAAYTPHWRYMYSLRSALLTNKITCSGGKVVSYSSMESSIMYLRLDNLAMAADGVLASLHLETWRSLMSSRIV